jgi:hypothetical protein
VITSALARNARAMKGPRTPGARILALALMLADLAACTGEPPLANDLPGASSATLSCNAAPVAGRPQLIVGYGSLMQDASRLGTSPRAGPAHPVEVRGYRRGWFEKPRAPGFGTTFLGLRTDRAGHFNAVVYEVDAAELAATDHRESSYCRSGVAPAQMDLLDADFALPAGAQAWIYVTDPRALSSPDASHPIVQSYVDVFVSGCLEQEERYHLAGFARECVATTANWSAHWVNDRILPRRPFVHQPRARRIDELLAAEVGPYFARMRIE